MTLLLKLTNIQQGEWYSNWLGKVQMGHADRAVIVCFLLAWWIHTFRSQFEYHMVTHTGLQVVFHAYEISLHVIRTGHPTCKLLHFKSLNKFIKNLH